MSQGIYTIKTMTRAELDLAIEWAGAEGWNPGLHDASCFYLTDPTGFLIGYLNDKPIASISVVKYGKSFGFLGFYIVLPEYRGQGYGLKIWQAGLDYLAGRNIGLDGVVAQQENYKKYGFKLAYRNIRYAGIGGYSPPPEHANIVPLSTLPLADIAAYDGAFFPEDRSQFIGCWIQQPDSYALGLIENGKLAGYGMIRPCRSGYKIGPLFADEPASAKALFLALTAKVKADDFVYLDVSEMNHEAVLLAEAYQMQVVFETARMYTGAAPNLPFNRLFGVTSFELG